jgi:hypothetical protein
MGTRKTAIFFAVIALKAEVHASTLASRKIEFKSRPQTKTGSAYPIRTGSELAPDVCARSGVFPELSLPPELQGTSARTYRTDKHAPIAY